MLPARIHTIVARTLTVACLLIILTSALLKIETWPQSAAAFSIVAGLALLTRHDLIGE